jgi:phosphatidylserine decarboxylase
LIEKSGWRIVTFEVFLIALAYTFFSTFLFPLVIILAFTLFFFRDPPRRIEEGVVSPADGEVDFVSGRKIEIFMSPLDCHVNRSPVDGIITKIVYQSGANFPAYKRRTNAERNEIYINNEDGEFKVTQIAGLFARRIVCYVKEGERVTRGQKIGMIRFGSRVILEVPVNFKFIKKMGERVKAGETIAVRLRIENV